MRWVITNKILAAIPKKKARNNWTNQQISNIITIWNCDFDHLPLPFLCFLHKTHGQYQPQSRRHQWKTMKNSNPQSTPSSKGSQPVHDSWLMSSACGWKTSSWNNKRKKNTVLVKHGWLREKTKQPWQWYNLYSSSLCSQQLVPGSHLRMVCRVEQWHKDLMCRETQWIPCKSSYIISFYIVIHWSFHHQEVINNNWRFPRFGPQYQWGEVQSWCGSLIARNGLLSTIWLRKQYLATSTGASLMRCITRFHK